MKAKSLYIFFCICLSMVLFSGLGRGTAWAQIVYPIVSDSDPAKIPNEDINVSPDRTIFSITFMGPSEMDPVTTGEAFSFTATTDAGNELKEHGIVEFGEYDTNIMTFTLTDYNLIAGASYTMKVRYTATDLDGNPLDGNGNGTVGEGSSDDWVMIFIVEEETPSAPTGWSVVYDTSDGLPGNAISSMMVDDHDRLWAGTSSNTGLCYFDGTSWTNKTPPVGMFPLDSIPCLALDREGQVWVGLEILDQSDPNVPKVATLVNDTWQLLRAKDLDNISPTSSIKGLAADPNDGIWIATYDITTGPSVLKYKNGTIDKHYTTSNGLPNDMITSLFIDQSDQVWIGTAFSGAYRLDQAGETWDDYMYDEMFSIEAMADDGEGNIWIGSYNNGLFKLDLSGPVPDWSVYTSVNGLPADSVTALAIDSQGGNLWVGTSAGLAWFCLPTGPAIAYTGDHGTTLSSTAINALATNSRGEVWFGTEQGLQLRDEVSPVVLQSIPTGGGVLGTTQKIQIIFSEPMNQAVTKDAFSVKDTESEEEVSGSIFWPDACTLTFTPGSPLTADRIYEISLGTSAQDLLGNALSESFSIIFSAQRIAPSKTSIDLNGSGCFIHTLGKADYKRIPWLSNFIGLLQDILKR